METTEMLNTIKKQCIDLFKDWDIDIRIIDNADCFNDWLFINEKQITFSDKHILYTYNYMLQMKKLNNKN